MPLAKVEVTELLDIFNTATVIPPVKVEVAVPVAIKLAAVNVEDE